MDIEETLRPDGFRECKFEIRGKRYRMVELDADQLLRLNQVEDETERALLAIAQSLMGVEGEVAFDTVAAGTEWIRKQPGGIFNALSAAFAELGRAEPGN